ncbi:MAG: hypothetical protein LUD16_12460 [Lachnospiraceae bacterium]|nr:hypothetical protein [Lachnospiraceae bacterium]
MEISVGKLDASTGEALAGAVLRLVDSRGNTVEEWTSDGSTHTFTAELREGETCQLVEVSAPDGYGIAGNQTFTAEEGASVSLTMEDPKHEVEEEKEVFISVTKTLIYDNGQSESRIGAENETFYVALYSDPECTQRVSEIQTLSYQHTDSATVTFAGLEAEAKYYVSECDAAGTAIVTGMVGDDTLFYADYAEGNEAVAENGGETVAVAFVNEFYALPRGFYKEAELTITKKLLGVDGDALADNAVFYAGIFADAAYTTLSDQVSYNIVELNMSGRSEVSAVVYVALDQDEPVTLYVTEVDEDGNPVAEMADFMYTVSVDNSAVTVSEAAQSAVVTITNQEIEVTEEESEETTESASEAEMTEKSTEKTTEKSTEASSVKTSDDIPITPYLALMLAAFAMLLTGGVYRRRGKR